MNRELARQIMMEALRAGSQVLKGHFGRLREYAVKQNQSSIVTAADIESERKIIEIIRRAFPGHSIIAEETGFFRRPSPFTWVIDPLDGTSNFAAGLPWFGVMIALLEHGEPIMAANSIPCMDFVYFSERGGGVLRNNEPVRVTTEPSLRNVLCAFGLDASGSEIELQQQAVTLCRVASRVRNVRATNSLVDLCFTLDGRLGACINLSMKIWDIAPVSLMLPEAGGRITELNGEPIRYELEIQPFDRNYTMLGANPQLHARLLSAIHAPGDARS